MKGYTEGRVLFDQYLEHSLKNNTREKRGQTKDITFQIHDDMNIIKLSLKELLSSIKTKAQLTEYLSMELLEDLFERSSEPCCIVWQPNKGKQTRFDRCRTERAHS